MSKIYMVHIPANVYNGRYYDFRATLVPVVANTPSDACNLVNDSRAAVVHYLASKKIHPSKRYLIPHKDPKKNIFFHNTYYASESNIMGLALHSDGQFKKVDTYNDTRN